MTTDKVRVLNTITHLSYHKNRHIAHRDSYNNMVKSAKDLPTPAARSVFKRRPRTLAMDKVRRAPSASKRASSSTSRAFAIDSIDARDARDIDATPRIA